MADADAKRHDTQHLDRHNDRIAVYQRQCSDCSRFTDDGEAVDDLLCRVPETATPQDVARLIGVVMEVIDDAICELQSDMAITTTSLFDPIEGEDESSVADAIERMAEAYLAVDRIDVEEVLARDDQSDDH
jgi:hypothetical protein